MSNCESDCGDGSAGPFSEGRALVDFVSSVHEGSLRSQPIFSGPLKTQCRGCKMDFVLETYVGQCPFCQGVHAVSPPRSDDEVNIQYAGEGFTLSSI